MKTTVTGPVTGGRRGRPFAATLMDFDQFGYVEEEFFIEGTANVYDTPQLATGTIVSSDHPYKMRIVVRRPADARRFNGTAVLEWQNATAGYDIDAVGAIRKTDYVPLPDIN